MSESYSVLRPPARSRIDADLGVHDAVDPDDFRPMSARRARSLLRRAGADLGKDQGRWLLETVDVLVHLTLDGRGRLTELELDVGGIEGRPTQATELLHVLATARAVARHLGGRLFDDAGVEVDDAHVADLLRSFRST